MSKQLACMLSVLKYDTHFGHIGPHKVYLQFIQHPALNGLLPPRTLPVTCTRS